MTAAAQGLCAGVLAGVAFFALLWLTVRRLPRSAHPARLLAASSIVRLALLLATFVLLAADGDAVRLLAGLVGVLGARAVALARAHSLSSAATEER